MTSDTNRLIRNTELGQGLRQLPGSESANDETDQNLRLLRLFNHYRHDWMNDIQILFGYVKLKKYDKLLDLMEKINEKVRQESYISKLGIPSLIVSLLAFQAEVKELRLDLHMDEEIRMQSLRHPEAAEALIRSLLDDFRKEAVSFPDDNHLQLHLSKYPGGIGLAARYEGGYDPKRLRFAESAIRSMGIDRYGWTVEARYGEGQVEWTVRLPASHDS